MALDVAVITLNWNGWSDTIDLLECFLEVDYEPLTVVVVDNASSDESVEKVRAWVLQSGVSHRLVDMAVPGKVVSDSEFAPHGEENKEFVLIRSDVNLGFCRGNNLGIKWAFENGADLALVLNNDTLVSRDFLGPMVEIVENEPKVGLIGGVITYCSDPDTVWWAGGRFNRFLEADRLQDGEPLSAVSTNRPFETDWISGCMMLIPSWVFSTVGGFDEEYFIWSEEWDYSARVGAAGYKLIVAPESRICHKVGRSLGVMKPLNYYYGIRNGLLFKRKFLPAYLWYPYVTYYLLNRIARSLQLVVQGRSDLAASGIAAFRDFALGRTGKWRDQP